MNSQPQRGCIRLPHGWWLLPTTKVGCLPALIVSRQVVQRPFQVAEYLFELNIFPRIMSNIN